MSRPSVEFVSDRVEVSLGLELSPSIPFGSGALAPAWAKLSELSGRRSGPGPVLVADLRRVCRKATDVSLDWELLAQGAGVRNEDLPALAQRCHPENPRPLISARDDIADASDHTSPREERLRTMIELTKQRYGQALVDQTALRTAVDAPVPTCPEWTVGRLVEHLGQTHHWIASIVEKRMSDPSQLPATFAALPADQDAWASWLAEVAVGAHSALTGTLAVLGRAQPQVAAFGGLPAGDRQCGRQRGPVHLLCARVVISSGSQPANSSRR